jgi:transcriptional regulator with XRE-family HTH domain
MATTLGQKIKELREGLDLSLRELAKKIDGDKQPSATHLSDIEQGNRYPSDELLASIAEALKTSLDELKRYDSRAPLDEIKKLSEFDPNYGFALRKLVDKKFSSEEIMKFVDKKKKEDK